METVRNKYGKMYKEYIKESDDKEVIDSYVEVIEVIINSYQLGDFDKYLHFVLLSSDTFIHICIQ